MKFSAQQIADFLEGEVIGNPAILVDNFSKIEEGHTGTLTFLSNPKYTPFIYTTKADIVLVDKSFEPTQPIAATLVKVENAYQALAKLLQLRESLKPQKTGIHSLAFVDETATLGEDAYIGAYAYLGKNVRIGNKVKIYAGVVVEDGVTIGDNTILYPHVTIYENCKIGNNCILHAGAVIGADGFGFAPNEQRHYDKIPQIGNVIIEDDVEIGANTTIDRATIDSTIIRKGSKIDNLVQIAHNVEIGEHTGIAAQTGIAGSTKIGKHCILAGQVGVVGHLNIADGSILLAQTGVPKSIKEPNLMWQGSPVVPVATIRRSSVVYQNLSDLQHKVYALEKQLNELADKKLSVTKNIFLMTKQTTLKSSFQLKGKGLHTGLNITLTMNPAPENTGYIIRRIDLEGQPEIPALADYVDRATRGTVLKKGDTVVSTVEHGLAALYAMGIDNCLIEVDAPEFPILDGSAKYYVDKINEVGIKTQNQPKDFFIVREKITYQLPNSPSSITLLPDDTFSVQTLIGYDSPILNNQYAILDDMSKFATEIAPCRTFVFVHELEPLLKMNLIKGGDLNNSIVIYDRQIPQEELQRIADLMNQPCPNVTSLGYLNTDLLFNNEPARHKMLDIIGDLALIGKPIKGRVIAVHPGHSTNTALAKQIRKELKRQEVSAPLYTPDATPILDTNQIKALLPHRYPFLLVDKVIEINNNYIVSVKNITVNEVQFLGHFPQEPVMPGVLIIEAMAQTAGLFVLSTMEDTKNLSTYLLKLDNVKFRNKVVPGDVLVMKVFLTTPVRRGVANVKGFAFVGNKIAAEAEMIAQLIDNTNS